MTPPETLAEAEADTIVFEPIGTPVIVIVGAEVYELPASSIAMPRICPGTDAFCIYICCNRETESWSFAGPPAATSIIISTVIHVYLGTSTASAVPHSTRN